jgi:hypothetical protein
MPTDEKEMVQHLLASRPGMTLRNIKFCRGDRPVITKEEFGEQVSKVVNQRSERNGALTPARSDLASIDVRSFVANIG